MQKIPLAFHDVQQGNFEAVQEMLDTMAQWGVECRTFMVVPEPHADFVKKYGGELSEKRNREFSEWLQNLKQNGALLFCHGLHHWSSETFSRSLAGKMQNRLTGGEAEFAGLSRGDAQMLLRESLRSFRNLGVGEPDGFAAPTWHGPAYLRDLCFGEGLEYFESRFAIEQKEKNKVASFPLSLPSKSSLGAFQRSLSVAGGFRRLFKSRLVLHPVDFETEEKVEALGNFIKDWKGVDFIGYSGLFSPS